MRLYNEGYDKIHKTSLALYWIIYRAKVSVISPLFAQFYLAKNYSQAISVRVYMFSTCLPAVLDKTNYEAVS